MIRSHVFRFSSAGLRFYSVRRRSASLAVGEENFPSIIRREFRAGVFSLGNFAD